MYLQMYLVLKLFAYQLKIVNMYDMLGELEFYMWHVNKFTMLDKLTSWGDSQISQAYERNTNKYLPILRKQKQNYKK